MKICPKCYTELSEEMIEANLCWECGTIIDERLLYTDEIEPDFENENSNIEEQALMNSYSLDKHKLTTGHHFQGFEIIDYKGIVSGEIVLGTGFISDIKADIFDYKSEEYSIKMRAAKEKAILNMIQESKNLGGNAIIGVSFNYVTFAMSNMIGISVNGTSVLIKHN